MLGTSHSWAVVMRNLLLQLKAMNNKLYLKSTNGNSLIPKELLSVIDRDIANPDIDICYTIPNNFAARFRKNAKIKMAIYNYETSKLPPNWVDKIKYIDYALPSSNFSKEVFVNAGWPEEKCIVIPHGINLSEYEDNREHRLYTNKSFKFLNVSIPHYRKNIDLLLDAYYSAFSNDDDVCLVLKTKLDMPRRKPFRFEVDVKAQIRTMLKKHNGKRGGLPQVEVVQDRLDSMVPLYNSCDVLISASSSEGFGMPLLEGLAAGKLVISPKCTGQLDFLNDNNSLLVDVKEIDAGEKYQYWYPSKGARTYQPIVDSLADSMVNAYKNKDELISRFDENIKDTVKEFTWENAAKKILDIL